MRVAVTKLTYWDKEGENIEVKGHKPDINCSGQDAFSVALTADVDTGRVKGFRAKNETPSEKQVFAQYDPKAATDPRKAYYAKYLDPAIAKIEQDNIESRAKEPLMKKLSQQRPSLMAKLREHSAPACKSSAIAVKPNGFER